MLFEYLTGPLPFAAVTQAAQLEAHLHESARPPSHFADVPAELDRLTLRLLTKDPRERIGYARDVADVLARYSAGVCDWASARRSRPHHYLYRSELMGRKRWLAEAQSTLEHCIAGRGARIFIADESGAGKTRLLSEIATRAVRMGMSVVPTECAAVSGDAKGGRQIRDSSRQALRPPLREVADRCREQPELRAELLAGRGSLLCEYEPALRGLDTEPPPPPVTHSTAHTR